MCGEARAIAAAVREATAAALRARLELERAEQKGREALARMDASGAYASRKVRRRALLAAGFLGRGAGAGRLRKSPMRALAAAGVGRNSPCPCGSGRKFKNCCIGEIT